uniref:dermonecrotic toxin domain-containing protein n=2 Tax=unclassified Pseudomonas TaxID=196821 RepID=UPI0015B6B8F9
YLRSVVSELDIGASYPAMLRRKLLDDPNGRVTRQRLLTTQLRSQLPALAQELYLRGKLPDQQAASRIAQVFWTAEDDEARRWIMRPLG